MPGEAEPVREPPVIGPLREPGGEDDEFSEPGGGDPGMSPLGGTSTDPLSEPGELESFWPRIPLSSSAVIERLRFSPPLPALEFLEVVASVVLAESVQVTAFEEDAAF